MIDLTERQALLQVCGAAFLKYRDEIESALWKAARDANTDAAAIDARLVYDAVVELPVERVAA